jgi:hypothetical protein
MSDVRGIKQRHPKQQSNGKNRRLLSMMMGKITQPGKFRMTMVFQYRSSGINSSPFFGEEYCHAWRLLCRWGL